MIPQCYAVFRLIQIDEEKVTLPYRVCPHFFVWQGLRVSMIFGFMQVEPLMPDRASK